MIKIYFHTSCTSSKKLFIWIKKYHISAEVHRIRSITRNDLLTLLSYSTEGIIEIIKHKNHTNEEVCNKLKSLENMTFNCAVDFLLQNTDLLRTPIVLGKDKYMIGYHVDNVRKFIPKEYRSRKYYN